MKLVGITRPTFFKGEADAITLLLEGGLDLLHIRKPGSLSEVAQRMNTKLLFDRKTKEITNNPFANALLVGEPPRKGWEEFYKI